MQGTLQTGCLGVTLTLGFANKRSRNVKKAMLAVMVSMLVSGVVFADRITLTTPETLSPASATHMDWFVDKINAKDKVLEVSYIWRNVDNLPIYLGTPNVWHTWTCQDIPVPGTNAECTLVEVPYPCCTGPGIGTCDDMEDTCFTDVFSFKIRSQDVGTSIGVGLRTLIWNKMRADILTGGNTGTFE